MIKRLAAAVGLMAGLAPVARAQDTATRVAPDTLRVTTISYISGALAYVSAGRLDGVREGTAMEVIRAGRVVASIRVQFLASRSSSGEWTPPDAALAFGDSVRYRPIAEPSRAIAGSGADSPARAASSRRSPIRGHVGLRYLSVRGLNGDHTDLRQPSADIRVAATNIGGTGLGFALDGRSRRTVAVGSSDERTYVYEAALSFDAAGTRVRAGRQYSPLFAPVSLFDGVGAEMTRGRWTVGAFGGVQPDYADMSLSTSIREGGGAVQVHSLTGGRVLWSVTTGAVGSQELGEINREFGFATVNVVSRRVALYAIQEVDLNRGWKRAAGEPALSPTSSFATLQVGLGDGVTVNGGFDNRRNVRLYRNYVSPETEFDDAFRQGYWGGATVHWLRPVRFGGDVRASQGGSAGDAVYQTATASVDPVTSARVGARLRSTHFRTATATGWLHSWSASTEPLAVLRLEVNGGARLQRRRATPGDSTSVDAPLPDARWIGVAADVSLGRSWYVLVSATRDRGGSATGTQQLYAGIVLRF